MDIDVFLSRLEAELPPTFARTSVPKLTGNIVSAGSLANEDSAGTGPAGLFYVGRRAVYERGAFLDWLRGRLTTQRRRGTVGGVENKAGR